jgi:hypothetical protein
LFVHLFNSSHIEFSLSIVGFDNNYFITERRTKGSLRFIGSRKKATSDIRTHGYIGDEPDIIVVLRYVIQFKAPDALLLHYKHTQSLRQGVRVIADASIVPRVEEPQVACPGGLTVIVSQSSCEPDVHG